MTAQVPTSPSSSPMAAKMKSVDTSGMRVGIPCPSPVPSTSPWAKAKRDWIIWYPPVSAWGQGSRQAWIRVCTWENMPSAPALTRKAAPITKSARPPKGYPARPVAE